jgi:hypothetical protein
MTYYTYHFSGDGTRIAHSFGHGGVALGVAVTDQVDPLLLAPTVRPSSGGKSQLKLHCKAIYST